MFSFRTTNHHTGTGDAISVWLRLCRAVNVPGSTYYAIKYNKFDMAIRRPLSPVGSIQISCRDRQDPRCRPKKSTSTGTESKESKEIVGCQTL